MPSIGDLANELARTLYEFRVPVALLSVAVAVGLVVIAAQLGWLAAARRHPRRTSGVVAIALVVLLPVGWYLGSPIFIRTSLIEAAPSVEPIATQTVSPSSMLSAPVTAPAPTGSVPATTVPTASASPTPAPFVARAIATGEFRGADDFHFGRGTASIIETSPGRYHLRLDDFSVRNGPDLYVYLSPAPDDWTKNALEVGVLKATDGSFGYDLPEGTDPADLASAIIWCKQFSQLFAVAPFEA